MGRPEKHLGDYEEIESPSQLQLNNQAALKFVAEGFVGAYLRPSVRHAA